MENTNIDDHDDILDLDHVPIDLQKPPSLVTPPPVITRAQILPCQDLLWENFERLCVRLASLDGDIDYCRLYGIRGQRQFGIALYARDKSSDKYRTYQCKQYQQLEPADIKDAIERFRKGRWFGCSSHFFLCTAVSSVATQLTEEYEHYWKLLDESG